MASISEAIVLVGGLGSRLRTLVHEVPKPMADVNGKPFLSLLMDLLINAGIQKIILAVGYKHEVIKNYYGDNYKGVTLNYSIEKEPAGTAGASYLASQLCDSKNILIMNGDGYAEIDFRQMFNYFSMVNKPIIVITKINNDNRYGYVEIQKNKIKSFNEKKSMYVNMGIYILPKIRLQIIKKNGFKSLENEFFPADIKTVEYCSYLNDKFFIDIGIPRDYLMLKKMMEEKNG